MSHQHATGQPVHDHPDTTGRHGMLLFGDEELYLSHLPMFHPPHDFQVLLRVRFDGASSDALLADRPAGGLDLYTFDPLEFPLAELDPQGGPLRTSIEGTIYRGHFERGGQPIVSGAVAEVLQVAYFQQLVDREPTEDAALSYLCFGRADRLHLAHEITARPSFDHVLTARIVPGSLTDMSGRPLDDDVSGMEFTLAQPVEFPRRDLPDSRPRAGETITGTLHQTSPPSGMHGFSAQLEVVGEVYLEVDELT